MAAMHGPVSRPGTEECVELSNPRVGRTEHLDSATSQEAFILITSAKAFKSHILINYGALYYLNIL